MTRKRFHRLLLWALLLAIMTTMGCYRHTYVVSEPTQEQPAKSDYFVHHFLAGLIPVNTEVELQSICPNGVGKIETQISFLNGFLNWLTNGIYTPKSTWVYCLKN